MIVNNPVLMTLNSYSGGVTNDAAVRLPDHAEYRATRANVNSAFVRTTRLAMSIHVRCGPGSYLPLHGPERGHRNAEY